MKQISSILGRSAIVAGLGLGAFALAAVADWSNPPASPPSCPSNIDGCSAPLNVGGNAQVKVGGITVGGIGITSSNFVFKPSQNAVPQNSVLTNGSSTDGVVSWGTINIPNISFDSLFAFKRSSVFTSDSVVWCPTDHPHVVTASLTDDSAPPAASLSDLGTTGCQLFDGPCPGGNGAPANSQRIGLGTDDTYLETVKQNSGANAVWGVRTYDSGHDHSAFRIDLICAK